MTFKRLSRRALLRGAGGIGIALPFLNVMEAKGQVKKPPVRFLGFATNTGTLNNGKWGATGTETSFSFNQLLQPLNPYKSKVLVFKGVDMHANMLASSAAHGATGGIFTGVPNLAGGQFSGQAGSSGYPSGPSIDQVLGQRLAGSTRFPSIVSGVRVDDSGLYGRVSYSASNTPVAPFNNPADVYQRLFSSFTAPNPNAPAPTVDRLQLERRSVIDAVKADFDALNKRVGQEDKARLDQHLTNIRQIETELQSMSTATPPPATSQCAVPAKPSIDYMAQANYPAVAKLQIDLIAMAFACELTRSAMLQWASVYSDLKMSWVGVTVNHHSLSHGEGASNAEAQHTSVLTWYSQQFAYLLGKLDAITEADGSTLLDNSTVMWGSDVTGRYGPGDGHARTDIPFLMAGKGGGYFRTGRYIDYGSNHAWHNDLLLAVMKAMGFTSDTFFGRADQCNHRAMNLT